MVQPIFGVDGSPVIHDVHKRLRPKWKFRGFKKLAYVINDPWEEVVQVFLS